MPEARSERWQKIEWLFHAALKREPSGRAEFLVEHCDGDASLYAEVTSLLAASKNSDSFFEETASPLAAEMFSNRVGESIGPYQVLSVLGSGGMGTVYLAQDVRLGRKIALKLLPPQFTNDKDRLRRFQQEARAASALNHPNILTVHEIEQRSDLHYIATEFVDGLTLRQRMSEAPISLTQALNIAIQIAGALEAAHRAGIAHRDIKPENVMIRSDGYVKVLDFGLAKLTEHPVIESGETDQIRSGTDPGIVMGTPRYMSPEQARGLDVDARTDIFSLGILLYEMLAGRVPFNGATASDVIATLLKDEAPRLSESIPEIPLELEQVVQRALSKKVGDRYQTVAEFAADLNYIKDGTQQEGRQGQMWGAGSWRASDPATSIGKAKSTNPDSAQVAKSVEVERKKKWQVGLITAALVLTVVVGGVITVASIIRWRASTAGSDQSNRSSGRALTIRSGYITAARFAPDGEGVIYSAAFDGKPVELLATNLDGSESRPVGIQSAALKDISLTGQMAVLLNFELSWNEGRNGTLALVPANGGEPQVLAVGIDEATFAPDGQSLAIVKADIMGQHQLEFPVGEVVYKSEGWISYPRFSRQGDKIAFFEHPLGDNSGSVMVLDVHSGTSVTLSTGWRALKGLAWSPRGDAVWFGGSRLGKKQNINSVSLSGDERLDIDELASYAKLEDISPKGTLLISHGNTYATMVILSEKTTSETLGTRFAWSTSADLSSDGNTLLFYEWGWETGDEVEVKTTYLRKLDGSNPVRLGEGRALGLSADGNWALTVREGSPPKLVLLPTREGKPKELPNPGFKEYHYGSWFPDGKRILFTALETHKDAFLRSYAQDIETGVIRPLTEEGSIAFRVSPNGKTIVVMDPYASYFIHSVDGSSDERPLTGFKRGDEPIQWSSDGRALYVRAAGDFATKVYRVDIASGRRRMWKEITPPNPIGLAGIEAKPGGVIITPDGKLCVYTYWTTLHELLLMDRL